MKKIIVGFEVLIIIILVLLYFINPFEKIISYHLFLKIGVISLTIISITILSLIKNKKNKLRIGLFSLVILFLIFLINYFILPSH